MLFHAVRARTVAAALALPLLAITINPPGASGSVQPASAIQPEAVKAGASVSPGRLTGYGFDACQAPDQTTMNELRRQSPFWGVGIYIGGQERACSQPNLTSTWVRAQRSLGWKLFPVWVGPQSACATRSFDTEISSSNATAKQQGAVAAHQAITAAKRLGIARGSTLFVDVEDYNNLLSACNQPVFYYMTGFNNTLAKYGWKGGLYAAGASGIAVLDKVRSESPGAYTWPTSVWIAHVGGATTRSKYLRNSLYTHQRMKQYAIDVTRKYGSVTLDLDINIIDIGGGALVPRPRPTCGVRVNFTRYKLLHNGSRGAQVKALQCLLKHTHNYGGKVTGRFSKRTAVAVGRFQSHVGLAANRKVGKSTWTALHSAGAGNPLLKRGSAADRVRSVQRSLTAALGRPVSATGYFNQATTNAVRRYQANIGISPNGIVGVTTWRALKGGRR